MKKTPLILAVTLSVLLAACGGQDSGTATGSAPAPAPIAAAPAPVAATPAPAVNAVGESVYKKTCALCHAAGVAGAPKPGDKADWEPRIAQGADTLHKHAIEGYTGSKGMMPPRGGGASLTDDEVKAAVDYMVVKSQ
ncbi:MAG: c-type cytochrome [Azoarcus sp.]|nr:c-type cytochrome [Azoarcus sp.]